MNNSRTHSGLLALCMALALTACGGGGGGDSGSSNVGPGVTPPSSGTYSWLLKAEGRTDNLKFALSLLHPQDTATEYLIEPASAAVTDAKLVATATVDVTTQQTGTLEPFALVYIVGGDVRRLPLKANGAAPSSRVTRAQSSSACRFVLEAMDYAAPEQSRFIVSTAGADGVCDTSDDGRGEVRLDATLGVVYAPITGAAPLAVLHDPATLAPRGWLLPTQAQLWQAGSSPETYRAAGEPVTRVVQATARSALVESARGLSVLDFGSSPLVTETVLPALNTTGWQGIGFDAQNFYAWRNGGTVASPTWSVQRISRTAPTASQLGSGAGQVTLASMGTDVLYATVLGASNVELRRFLKAVPGAVTLLSSGPSTSSFLSVITGAAGVHQQWRVSGLGTAAPSYVIEMVDEQGSVLFSSAAGGFSLGPAQASRVNFNSSESRNRFLFVEGYGERFFGDAALLAYDTTTRAATRVGRLPGSAEFGADFVFANIVAGPTALAGGFASRSIGGVVQASGTRVFSFEPGTANSLKTTTRQL